jgi:hypothetical protein
MFSCIFTGINFFTKAIFWPRTTFVLKIDCVIMRFYSITKMKESFERAGRYSEKTKWH